MKRTALTLIASVMLLNPLWAQTGSTASASTAIKTVKTIKENKDKISYLVKEAQKLYASKEFNQVITIANYILTNVDSESKEAKSLLEKAQSMLAKEGTKQAKAAVKGLL